MNSWFANISVNLKLGLGFGLVLLLTGLLALTGWNSLGSLINRSNWMSDITQLNLELTNLRVARLQYMLANGDDTAAANTLSKLEAFSTQQKHLLATFKSPENVKLLNELSAIIDQYRVSLDKMRQGYRTSLATREAMNTTAQKASEAIDAISADVLARGDADSRLAQYLVISKVKQQLTQVRVDVRGYIAEQNATAEQAAMRQFDAALAEVETLKRQLPDDAARLQQLDTALLSYRSALGQFRDATGAVAVARQEMTVQGNTIVKISDDLYKIQLERRDAESAEARSLQLFATALALLFGVLAAFLITRQITRPLRETLDVVEKIASGDLTQNLRVTRRDELGVLQQGIARMGTTLRDLISGIRDGVTQIASAAEELSAVTQQTSSGANSQKAETDQVATAMHEMAATVQEVARNAEHASHAANTADGQAREGDRVVGEAIGQIERLAAEVQRSTEAMNLLQQESQKIGSVMDVIKSVAEQTNLLALNAAIEAARAGEAGPAKSPPRCWAGTSRWA
ncbi:methyl-accepting chemotaxis protein, partial [Pseudomonas sp. NPDC089554]|uniref:methyl-accepting chemotaxis protein n=1 Tax=Pseudomonas sp. NPDC089554 TaxID=3390653 RepID=UPI003D083C91